MSRDPFQHLVLTIGAMKSGTTTLHESMALHPEISMAAVKEPSFFAPEARRWASPTWHRWNLRGFRPVSPRRVRVWGESSTNYAKFPQFMGVPERIRDAAPGVRLLYVLRDPVRRAWSHYIHNLAHGREQRAPLEAFAALDPSNRYVAASLYALQLEQYLRVFERDRVHVLTLDDLSGRPAETMRAVFAHIGVDPAFTHPHFGRVTHESAAKNAPTALGAAIQDLPGGRILRSALRAVTERPFERPAFPPELEARLRDVFAPDVQRLRAETGLALEGW